MAVQHELGAAVKRGAKAFLDIVQIGIDYAVDQWVALFDLSPLALVVAIILIFFIVGALLRWFLYEFVWGLLTLAGLLFLVGGLAWLMRGLLGDLTV